MHRVPSVRPKLHQLLRAFGLLSIPTRKKDVKQFVGDTQQQENCNNLSKCPPFLFGVKVVAMDSLFKRNNQVYAE